MNMIEKLKTIENTHISEFVNSIAAASTLRLNPKIVQEQELLVMISKITDNETANKARGLYHSQYHTYDFDTYLSILLKLCNILESGVSENDAFKLINTGFQNSYLGFKAMLDL